MRTQHNILSFPIYCNVCNVSNFVMLVMSVMITANITQNESVIFSGSALQALLHLQNNRHYRHYSVTFEVYSVMFSGEDRGEAVG